MLPRDNMIQVELWEIIVCSRRNVRIGCGTLFMKYQSLIPNGISLERWFIVCSEYSVWVGWGINNTKILAAFLYHIHVVIDIVERVKSQESRVSVFRLAQPVGRGNGQQERNYYSKHGQFLRAFIRQPFYKIQLRKPWKTRGFIMVRLKNKSTKMLKTKEVSHSTWQFENKTQAKLNGFMPVKRWLIPPSLKHKKTSAEQHIYTNLDFPKRLTMFPSLLGRLTTTKACVYLRGKLFLWGYKKLHLFSGYVHFVGVQEGTKNGSFTLFYWGM